MKEVRFLRDLALRKPILTCHEQTHAGLLYRRSKAQARPSDATYQPLKSEEHRVETIDPAEEDDDDDDDTRTLVGDPDSPTIKSPRSFPNKGDGFDTPGKEVDEWDPGNEVQWGLKELLSVKSIQRMLWSLFLLS